MPQNSNEQPSPIRISKDLERFFLILFLPLFICFIYAIVAVGYLLFLLLRFLYKDYRKTWKRYEGGIGRQIEGSGRRDTRGKLRPRRREWQRARGTNGALCWDANETDRIHLRSMGRVREFDQRTRFVGEDCGEQKVDSFGKQRGRDFGGRSLILCRDDIENELCWKGRYCRSRAQTDGIKPAGGSTSYTWPVVLVVAQRSPHATTGPLPVA